MRLISHWKAQFWDKILKILDSKVNVFSNFFSKTNPAHPKSFILLKYPAFNISFAKFIEKSIVGKLLLSYLKVVTSLMFLTRWVFFLYLWIDFGKMVITSCQIWPLLTFDEFLMHSWKQSKQMLKWLQRNLWAPMPKNLEHFVSFKTYCQMHQWNGKQYAKNLVD